MERRITRYKWNDAVLEKYYSMHGELAQLAKSPSFTKEEVEKILQREISDMRFNILKQLYVKKETR